MSELLDEKPNEYVEPENSTEPVGADGQYTKDEIESAISVFRLLLRWRNEDRKNGIIDW